jgi:hypothetical protein
LIDKLEKSRKQLLQLSDPWQSLKLDENQKKCRSKILPLTNYYLKENLSNDNKAK